MHSFDFRRETPELVGEKSKLFNMMKMCLQTLDDLWTQCQGTIFLSFFETDSGSCCRGIWQNMWAIHMLSFTKHYRRQTSYLEACPYPLGYHAQGSTVSGTGQTHWYLDWQQTPRPPACSTQGWSLPMGANHWYEGSEVLLFSHALFFKKPFISSKHKQTGPPVFAQPTNNSMDSCFEGKRVPLLR